MNSNEKNEKDASHFQTSGALLQALKDWAGIPEQFPYGLGALFLNFMLFQLELVPRWLSVWGLVGGTLILAMGFLRMFGRPVYFLALPIILNELALSIWLFVVGFNSSSKTSVIVGVLFITALASSMLNGYFIKSIDTPDYLTAASANENKVLVGVLFQITLTVSVVAIPIIMFPILKEHYEVLALGYIGARIFEGFFDVVIALSQLMLLSLSRTFMKTKTLTAKAEKNEIQ